MEAMKKSHYQDHRSEILEAVSRPKYTCEIIGDGDYSLEALGTVDDC
jgi:hypothetical protein